MHGGLMVRWVPAVGSRETLCLRFYEKRLQ